MVYRRDPLSVRYDRTVRAMISRAVTGAARGRWIIGVLESGAHEQRERQAPYLSVSERAFQQALYHDRRIHKPPRKGGQPRSNSGDYSLKVDWRERIGRRRFVAIRLYTDTSGARKVRRDYGPESYVKNPALRSTYAAEGQTAGTGRYEVDGRGRRARGARHGT